MDELKNILAHCRSKKGTGCIGCAWEKKGSAVECWRALVNKVSEVIESNEAEAEIEGGGMTWFFVCGNCHTTLMEHAKYCHECGRRIKWV